jgi:hypothetical protein
MHRIKSPNLKFWSLVFLLLVSFVSLANFLDAGSSEPTKRFEKLNSNFSDEKCKQISPDGCVDAYIQLLNFNPQTQYLDGRIFIYPPEKYALQFMSSVQVKYATDVYLDAAKVDAGELNQNLYFEKNENLRGIDFTIDVTNVQWESRYTEESFPFDHYSSEISGSVVFVTDPGKTDEISDDTRVTLPIRVLEYSGVLPNWKIKYDYSYKESVYSKGEAFSSQDAFNFQKDGSFFTVFILERSDVTVLIVCLLGSIFIGGAISILLLLRSVLMSHKTSSLTGLVWAGSTAFTMIQTRGLVPGEPRIGVLFDLYIFYPSLAMCFISALLILRIWLKSDSQIQEP